MEYYNDVRLGIERVTRSGRLSVTLDGPHLGDGRVRLSPKSGSPAEEQLESLLLAGQLSSLLGAAHLVSKDGSERRIDFKAGDKPDVFHVTLRDLKPNGTISKRHEMDISLKDKTITARIGHHRIFEPDRNQAIEAADWLRSVASELSSFLLNLRGDSENRAYLETISPSSPHAQERAAQLLAESEGLSAQELAEKLAKAGLLA